jgi:hypothetical protein
LSRDISPETIEVMATTLNYLPGGGDGGSGSLEVIVGGDDIEQELLQLRLHLASRRLLSSISSRMRGRASSAT